MKTKYTKPTIIQVNVETEDFMIPISGYRPGSTSTDQLIQSGTYWL